MIKAKADKQGNILDFKTNTDKNKIEALKVAKAPAGGSNVKPEQTKPS